MDGSYTKRSIRLTKVGIIVYTADNRAEKYQIVPVIRIEMPTQIW